MVTRRLDQKTWEKHIAQHERQHDKGTPATWVRGKGDTKQGDCYQQHNGSQKGKGNGAQRPRSVERPRSPSPRRELSPSEREAQNWKGSFWKEKTSRRVSSSKKVSVKRGQDCDDWHPPISTFHKKRSCSAGSQCAFTHQENFGRHPKMPTKPQGKLFTLKARSNR